MVSRGTRPRPAPQAAFRSPSSTRSRRLARVSRAVGFGERGVAAGSTPGVPSRPRRSIRGRPVRSMPPGRSGVFEQRPERGRPPSGLDPRQVGTGRIGSFASAELPGVAPPPDRTGEHLRSRGCLRQVRAGLPPSVGARAANGRAREGRGADPFQRSASRTDEPVSPAIDPLRRARATTFVRRARRGFATRRTARRGRMARAAPRGTGPSRECPPAVRSAARRTVTMPSARKERGGRRARTAEERGLDSSNGRRRLARNGVDGPGRDRPRARAYPRSSGSAGAGTAPNGVVRRTSPNSGRGEVGGPGAVTRTTLRPASRARRSPADRGSGRS
jgi:hypothetical protein